MRPPNAILEDAQGHKYARMVLLTINGQECEAFELPCELFGEDCTRFGLDAKHGHFAPLWPVSVGGRN